MVERSTTVRFLPLAVQLAGGAAHPDRAGLARDADRAVPRRRKLAWAARLEPIPPRTRSAEASRLIIAALIPKPVPDEQNFAATPAIKSWFETKTAERQRAELGGRIRARRRARASRLRPRTPEPADTWRIWPAGKRPLQRSGPVRWPSTRNSIRPNLILNRAPKRPRRYWKD